MGTSVGLSIGGIYLHNQQEIMAPIRSLGTRKHWIEHDNDMVYLPIKGESSKRKGR